MTEVLHELFQPLVPGTPEQNEKVAQVKKLFSDLTFALENICPAGRRLSIAKTELETAQMYAVKAIFY